MQRILVLSQKVPPDLGSKRVLAELQMLGPLLAGGKSRSSPWLMAVTTGVDAGKEVWVEWATAQATILGGMVHSKQYL